MSPLRIGDAVETTRVRFAAIIKDLTDPMPAPQPEQRIIVLVELPQIDDSRELAYGCKFPVSIGDAVLCPPMPLWPKWQAGIVTGFGSNGYDGPVKYVAPVGGGES